MRLLRWDETWEIYSVQSVPIITQCGVWNHRDVSLSILWTVCHQKCDKTGITYLQHSPWRSLYPVLYILYRSFSVSQKIWTFHSTLLGAIYILVTDVHTTVSRIISGKLTQKSTLNMLYWYIDWFSHSQTYGRQSKRRLVCRSIVLLLNISVAWFRGHWLSSSHPRSYDGLPKVFERN